MIPVAESTPFSKRGGVPWRTAALVGLAGFVAGVVGPFYDSYVTPLLKGMLAGTALPATFTGAIMGIDNALALALTPFFAAWSDRTRTRLGRRVPFVVAGLPVAAIAFGTIPFAANVGMLAMLATIVIYASAQCAARAPTQALVADLIPSRARSFAVGVSNVLMCVGAMAVLLTSPELKAIDEHLHFAFGAALVLGVAVIFALKLREPPLDAQREEAGKTAAGKSTLAVLRAVVRAADSPMLRFLLGAVFFNMAFQAFSTWFTSYGGARWGLPPEACFKGMILVAMANLFVSIPAAHLATRFGRRRIACVGLAGMAIGCLAASVPDTLPGAMPFIALFGASWATTSVCLMPMALEIAPAAQAATFLAAMFICQNVGGMIGPPLCGRVFDFAGSERPLFVMMAAFIAVGFAWIVSLPRGYAEATDGP